VAGYINSGNSDKTFILRLEIGNRKRRNRGPTRMGLLSLKSDGNWETCLLLYSNVGDESGLRHGLEKGKG